MDSQTKHERCRLVPVARKQDACLQDHRQCRAAEDDVAPNVALDERQCGAEGRRMTEEKALEVHSTQTL